MYLGRGGAKEQQRILLTWFCEYHVVGRMKVIMVKQTRQLRMMSHRKACAARRGALTPDADPADVPARSRKQQSGEQLQICRLLSLRVPLPTHYAAGN